MLKKPSLSATAVITVLALGSLLLSGCSMFGQKIKPYTFNNATIELTQTGNMQGTTIAYFKGDKALYETHATRKLDGKEENVNNLFIDLGDTVYQIDLDTKTGTKSKNPIYEQLKKTPSEKRMDFLISTLIGGPADGQTQMPQPKEQKTIAGQKCDLYEVQGISQICVWNGIPIFENIKIPESNIEVNIVANKIDLNTNIPDSKFQIPAGIDFKDSTGAQT